MKTEEKVPQNDTAVNFGYYIIPFSINKFKYNKLKKRLKKLSTKGEENKTKDKNRFKNCRYIFSSVKELYRNNTYYTIDLKDIKSNANTNTALLNATPIINNTKKIKSIINAELPKLFPKKEKNEKKKKKMKTQNFQKMMSRKIKVKPGKNFKTRSKDLLRFSARLEEISVSLIERQTGYLIYKVNYNGMTLKEIEQFSYFFRRIVNSTKHNSSFAKITCLLLGCENYASFERQKKDLTKPFYYTSFKNSFSCDVLQVVTTKIERNFDAHCFCLGRGYKSIRTYIDGLFDKSDYDMKFSTKKDQTWVGSPGTLTCIINKPKMKPQYIKQNIENDYLCLYITLLNQRYTLLSMMTNMVKNRNSKRKLAKIHDKLSMFKLAESFKVISNEYDYQNIYERMYKILDIDNLIHDIDEISYTVKQQKSRNLENLLKAFTLISSTATLYRVINVLYPLYKQSQETLDKNAYADFCLQINIIILTSIVTLTLLLMFVVTPVLKSFISKNR